MGEAKRRGTFEDRKAKAVDRNIEIEKLRRAHEALRPKDSGKVSVTSTAPRSKRVLNLAIAAMLGSSAFRKY